MEPKQLAAIMSNDTNPALSSGKWGIHERRVAS